MSKIVKLDISVVGLQFRLKRDMRNILAGKKFNVRLQREPDNRFDGNAIQVLMSDKKYGLLEGQHIGYVRRGTAETIAPRMDEGSVTVLSAVMSDVDPESGDAALSVKLRKA